MYKICINIISAVIISVVTEIILDHYFRKPKSRLKLSNLKNEK